MWCQVSVLDHRGEVLVEVFSQCALRPLVTLKCSEKWLRGLLSPYCVLFSPSLKGWVEDWYACFFFFNLRVKDWRSTSLSWTKLMYVVDKLCGILIKKKAFTFCASASYGPLPNCVIGGSSSWGRGQWCCKLGLWAHKESLIVGGQLYVKRYEYHSNWYNLVHKTENIFVTFLWTWLDLAATRCKLRPCCP